MGSGFVFVVTAAEDICSPEGEIVWKKGDTVQEIVTDEKGMACAENLFPGKYQVEEKQSGEYYAVDKGKHEAEIRVTEGTVQKTAVLRYSTAKPELHWKKQMPERRIPWNR